MFELLFSFYSKSRLMEESTQNEITTTNLKFNDIIAIIG